MTADTIERLVTGLFTIASIIIGLMIKNSLAEMKLSAAKDKAELLAHQNEVKEELVAEQTKVRSELAAQNSIFSQALAVHVATDELRFKNLEQPSHVQVNVQK